MNPRWVSKKSQMCLANDGVQNKNGHENWQQDMGKKNKTGIHKSD